MKTISVCVCFVFIFRLCCGQDPEILASKGDIRSAKADTERMRITALPIEDYPLLVKFKRLRDVDFYRNGATDGKLRELAKLSFTNLQVVTLLDCPSVTDEGIRALVSMPSIRAIHLEGTSVTDTGIELVALKMRLTRVSTVNCKSVTRKGVQILARGEALTEFGFSADTWTDEQVLELIDSFKNVKWCLIVDPQRRLDTGLLKARGKAKGIQIVVKATGAIQDQEDYRKRQGR